MSVNTIHLAGEYRKLQSHVLAASNAPYPGMVLKLDSDGKMAIQTTIGADCEVIVAFEDALQGKTVSDVYTAGDIVDCGIELPGSEFQGLVAAGQNIAKGDIMTVSAAGKWIEKSSTYKNLAIALEDCDLSGSGAVDALCAMRRI